MAKLPPVPNVVIIGLDHNVCRWLRFNLDRHPHIFMPPIATDFFTDEDQIERLGQRWYREQFHGWEGEPFLGEYGASYATFLCTPREVVDRLRRRLPGARYLVVLGDPVDRFVAEACRRIRDGRLPADLDVEAFCRFQVEPELGLELVADGIVSTGVHAFADQFGDALAPVLIDDIRADPVAAYRSAVAHIGADPDVVPDGLDLVRYDDEHVVSFGQPSVEARQMVYAWYRQDVTAISTTLDLDLSSWDPGGTGVADEFLSGWVEAHTGHGSTA